MKKKHKILWAIYDQYGTIYYWCTEECFEQNAEKGGM